MMTESDARQHWCPFARAISGDAELTAGVNRARRNTPDIDCYCLASQCMAWRWYGDDLGYCGLAGPTSD